MKTIVITGSTRGIGLGLAAEFLKRECHVVVNGRSQSAVDQAVKDLAGWYPPDRVWGQPGDMTHYDQVQQLWDTAQAHFGSIDIWINNAGVAHPDLEFWDLPQAEIDKTVSLNLIGLMYGCRVAINGMLAQGRVHLQHVRLWQHGHAAHRPEHLRQHQARRQLLHRSDG